MLFASFMDDAATLELLARGAAVGAFLGLAIIGARGGPTPARVTGVLFCLGAAAHTLTQMPGDMEGALGWAWTAVWALSAMGAGLFWAFVLELFDDRARLEPRLFAPAALLLAISAGAGLTEGPTSSALLLVHNLASAALIGHALVRVAAGWRDDLVEARRRLRGPILAAAAVYALAVIAVQTAEIFLGSAAALSPLGALALMILGLLSLAAFGRIDPDLFGPARAPYAEESAEVPSPISAEDAAAAAALDRLMREERVYREEGLTIAALALRLKLPEHRLRRLINQRLGHRNFSAFLNTWRLADAKAALADPAQAAVPISTIALDAGYGSLGPFNRAFKAETGLTPTEYRAGTLGARRDEPSRATPAT